MPVSFCKERKELAGLALVPLGTPHLWGCHGQVTRKVKFHFLGMTETWPWMPVGPGSAQDKELRMELAKWVSGCFLVIN